jgi:hypothetical protein
MATKEKPLKEATREDEQALVSVVENKKDVVTVRGKKFRIGWMHPAVGDWISSLIAKEGNDNKILSQASALIVLKGFWKCHLWYWVLWRWFYYIRQYTAMELTPILKTAQKKTAQGAAVAYLNGTMLLIALSTTKKQMTKEEAERSLQELRSANAGK